MRTPTGRRIQPQRFYTTTPRPLAWLKKLVEHELIDFLREGNQPGGGSGGPAVEQLLTNLEARMQLEVLLKEQFDLDLLEEARWRVQQRVEARPWEALPFGR